MGRRRLAAGALLTLALTQPSQATKASPTSPDLQLHTCPQRHFWTWPSFVQSWPLKQTAPQAKSPDLKGPDLKLHTWPQGYFWT